jgi:hypothetical protein
VTVTEPHALTGWVCPHCNTAYAPDVKACECSSQTRPLAERIAAPPVVHFPVTYNCTCGTLWNCILPPPPCPVHGLAQTFQVFC